MKRGILISVFIIISFACKHVVKQEKNNTAKTEVSQEHIESNWMVLFDGTSFDKWRGYLSEDMFSEWTIEDNAMVFTPSDAGRKNIITKDKFTNFVLSIEWKISEGGNSGIFWGIMESPDLPEAYLSGPEIQVLDNAKHPDSFVAGGTHKAGSLYDLVTCNPILIHPAGQWNSCELTINHKTNQGKIVMNGKEALKFPVHGDVWDNMIQNSKFKGWEHFGKHQTGHIGLQDHGDKVWFRNIKIKNL